MPVEFFRTVLNLVDNAALLMLGVLAYCYVRGRASRWPEKVSGLIEGGICGLIAMLSMLDPMQAAPGIQIDSRNSIVALATLFGGPVPGIVAVAIAASCRLWIGGVGAMPGMIGIGGSFVVVDLFRRWLRAHKIPVNHFHLIAIGLAMVLLVLVSVTVSGGFALAQRSALPILLIVPPSMLLFGAIVLRCDRAFSVENSLQKNEALLRAIVNNLPDSLSIRDRENRFLLINKSYEENTGRTQDVIGKDARIVWDVAGVTRDLEENAAQVWKNGQSVRSAPLLVSRQGRKAWVVCTTFPIFEPDGKIESVGTLTTDVSEMIAAREELQRREQVLLRHQTALTEILRVNSSNNRSFVEEARPILELIARALDVDRVGLLEIDFESDTAYCLDDWNRTTGNYEMVLDARISDFAELLRDVERQRVVVVEDALDDPRFAARREVMKKLGVRGGMLAASYLGGKLQAILNIRQIGSPRRWTPEEITFAQSAAGVVSLLLLTRQHREALAALNLVTDSIFAEREDGRVIYANRPALELAGLPSRDLSVARVLSLSAHHFPHAGVPLEGSRDLHEIDWNNKTLEIHRSRLPGGGIISVIEDVTNRRAGQREREQLQQQLQQASRMEAIGQLAGGVAHDFNNLLGSISGFAGFLDQDIPKDTEQHHFVRRILSACERGKALVDQIMTFSRTRAIEQVAVDLRQVMQHSRELLSGAMPLSVRLSFDLGHGPVMVLGNEDQIGQIVANLCINARDALPDRSGDISVQLANVFPGAPDYRRTFLVGTLNPNRRYARIDVRDSGAGIAPEHLSRIFEPFFTTKERGHGTGLGLAIVHGIIVSYEGACAVESALGQGTCFSIYLPVIERPALSQPIETKAEDARGRERILVIDDEVDITDVLSIGLERLGYEVGALNDSLEAFDAFTEDPNAWDVVVTDHSMPGLTGLEIAEKIKALRPDVAVILCTGLDDGVLRPAAQKAGIDGFLVKPTTPERIAGLVRGLRRSGHRTVAGS